VSDSDINLARQIAQAASDFEEQITGHAPKTVTVVMSDQTLVVTIHGSLSSAELTAIQQSQGATRVQDFYRKLFTNASYSLRQEIERIAGVEVREATAEVDLSTGTVVKVFTTGKVAEVVLLARSVPGDS
jgi:uncharacterized protein YbcI